MSRRSRAAAYDALTGVLPDFPGYDEEHSLDLPPLSERQEDQLRDLITTRSFSSFSEALAKVGNCSRPIRLVGRSQTIDTRTGEVLASYSSADEALGVTYVKCGNRRASECASCAREYAGDTFQLIRAGIAGGKTVPETVADNPLVFATLTAPSFGPVHGHRDAGPCRPPTKQTRCRHGRPTGCLARHDVDDPQLGQPLCEECYDYDSHVVWQWWAPTLFRRFTTLLKRRVATHLGVPRSQVHLVATVQYAKVAEYQRRGVIHFHVLIRLDGPRTAEGFAPAPADVDASLLAALVRKVGSRVRLRVPGVDPEDPDRLLAFGRQLDARPVRTSRRTDDPEEALSADQVAGYVAKYATKSVGDTAGPDNPHYARIRRTVLRLAARAATVAPPDATETEAPYLLLDKWRHMLGFRGHFASKSRRFSVTLTALRRARRRAQAAIAESQRTGTPLDLASMEAELMAADDQGTTLVIGEWSFVGTGWANEAQTLLANAAAARAREYDQWRAQIRHEKYTNTRSEDDG